MRIHRVPLEDRIRIGAELRAGRYAGRGERAVLARGLAVTVRELWNWEHRLPGKVGRPPRPDALVREATEACRAVLEAQGYGTWWKKIWHATGRRYTKTLVQEC